MIKITTADEPLTVNNICVVVYGQPGIGKTSTAFTAQNPLLLDFDNGAKRSGFRKDSVQVSDWKDIEGMSASDIEGYDTIVVDTVGRLLDALAINIIRQNPKMKGYGGALSLQGYGALKSAYTGWLKELVSYGKDVILIAHDKEDKNGDDLIVRPDIQGGSYGEVFKSADSVGYLHKAGRSTVLDFSPTDSWAGKNAAGFDTLTVPNFATYPDWMGSVMEGIKDALNKLSEAQAEAIKVVADWRTKAENAADKKDINKLVSEILKADYSKSVTAQVKAIINDKALSMGLEFKDGEYSAKEAA